MTPIVSKKFGIGRYRVWFDINHVSRVAMARIGLIIDAASSEYSKWYLRFSFCLFRYNIDLSFRKLRPGA